MTENTNDNSTAEQSAEQVQRQPYRRPVMTKLGSLRDVTMTINPGSKNDGMPSRATSRGGDFDPSNRAR
jgi:hypothetical protein